MALTELRQRFFWGLFLASGSLGVWGVGLDIRLFGFRGLGSRVRCWV